MHFIGKTYDVLVSFEPRLTIGVVSILENGQFTYCEQYQDGIYDMICMRFMSSKQCFVWDYTDLVNFNIYELGRESLENNSQCWSY